MDACFSHQIDHIVSRKHGGLTTFENLAFACVLCNRNKGADLGSIDAKTGELVRLFHPRQDRWADHFSLAGAIILDWQLFLCANSTIDFQEKTREVAVVTRLGTAKTDDTSTQSKLPRSWAVLTKRWEQP